MNQEPKVELSPEALGFIAQNMEKAVAAADDIIIKEPERNSLRAAMVDNGAKLESAIIFGSAAEDAANLVRVFGKDKTSEMVIDVIKQVYSDVKLPGIEDFTRQFMSEQSDKFVFDFSTQKYLSAENEGNWQENTTKNIEMIMSILNELTYIMASSDELEAKIRQNESSATDNLRSQIIKGLESGGATFPENSKRYGTPEYREHIRGISDKGLEALVKVLGKN